MMTTEGGSTEHGGAVRQTREARPQGEPRSGENHWLLLPDASA